MSKHRCSLKARYVSGVVYNIHTPCFADEESEKEIIFEKIFLKLLLEKQIGQIGDELKVEVRASKFPVRDFLPFPDAFAQFPVN